jgi:hypothetical protein
MVHTNAFVVDLNIYVQSIKQLTDGLSIYVLYEVFIHLSVCVVRDSAGDPLPKGCTCTCPKPSV